MAETLGKMMVRKGVLALYALATLLLSFAHQPVLQAGAGGEEDLSAYVLPDGSFPLICGWDEAEGSPPASQYGAFLCDACLLTSAPGLPPVSAVAAVSPSGGLAVRLPGTEGPHLPHHRPRETAQPRAPPVFSA